MEDTSPEMRAVQQRIWMSLSEADRFRKGAEMFELATLLARKRAPAGLSEAEITRFVFKEMYGFEMPRQREGEPPVDRSKNG